MKTQKILIIVFISVLLTSCVSTAFIQVYKATPAENVVLTDNQLVYEDQNCRVSYNLWDEGGNIGFQFYNKSDENIYLNLEESFFVLNGIAYNYFKNRVYTNSTNTGTSVVNLSQQQANKKSPPTPVNVISNSGYSVAYSEEKIVCIPPHATKIISEYTINRALFRDCDLLKYPTKRKIKAKTFTKEESPFVFSNRIAYTVGQSKNLIRFVNEFYVTEITNYPEGELLEIRNATFCDEKSDNMITIINNSSADKFYLRYTKVDDAKY